MAPLIPPPTSTVLPRPDGQADSISTKSASGTPKPVQTKPSSASDKISTQPTHMAPAIQKMPEEGSQISLQAPVKQAASHLRNLNSLRDALHQNNPAKIITQLKNSPTKEREALVASLVEKGEFNDLMRVVATRQKTSQKTAQKTAGTVTSHRSRPAQRDNPSGRITDLGHILAPVSLPPEAASELITKLLDGWTTESREESITTILEGMQKRDPAKLEQTLLSLHENGRIPDLISDLDGRERNSMVSLLLTPKQVPIIAYQAASEVHSSDTSDTTSALLNDKLDLAIESQKPAHTALLAALSEDHSDPFGEEEASSWNNQADASQLRTEKAKSELLRRLNNPQTQATTFDSLTRTGDLSAILETLGSAALPALNTLAREDAKAMLNGTSNGAPYQQIAAQLLRSGNEDALRSLILDAAKGLPQDQAIPYFVAATGSDIQSVSAYVFFSREELTPLAILKENKDGQWKPVLDHLKNPAEVMHLTQSPRALESLRLELTGQKEGASFETKAADLSAKIEKSFRTRVHFRIPPAELQKPKTQESLLFVMQNFDRVAQAFTSADTQMPARVDLHLEQGLIKVKAHKTDREAPDVQETQNQMSLVRAQLAELGVAHVGIMLAGKYGEAELISSKDLRLGLAELPSLLSTDSNHLFKRDIHSVKIGRKTEVHEFELSLPKPAEKKDKDGKVIKQKAPPPLKSHVLEISAKTLARLASPHMNVRDEARAEVLAALGDIEKSRTFSLGTTIPTGDGNVASASYSASVSPLKDDPSLKLGASHQQGGDTFASVSKKIELPNGTTFEIKAGRSEQPFFVEVHAGKRLYDGRNTLGRNTQVAAGAFFSTGLLNNTGIRLDSRHEWQARSLLAYDKTEMSLSWELLGGGLNFNLEHQFQDAPDDASYPIVGFNPRLGGPFAGWGFKDVIGLDSLEIKVGAYGLTVGADEGLQVTITPWHFPWVMIHHGSLLDRYGAATPLQSADELRKLQSGKDRGTSNLDPTVLDAVFHTFLESHGVDAKPQEISAFLEDKGYGYEIADRRYELQTIATRIRAAKSQLVTGTTVDGQPLSKDDKVQLQQFADKSATRFYEKKSEFELLISEAVVDLQIAEYLMVKDNGQKVSAEDVEERFNAFNKSDGSAFTVVKADILEFKSEQNAVLAGRELKTNPEAIAKWRRSAVNESSTTLAKDQLGKRASLEQGQPLEVMQLPNGRFALMIKGEEKKLSLREAEASTLPRIKDNLLQLKHAMQANANRDQFYKDFSTHLRGQTDHIYSSVQQHRASLLKALPPASSSTTGANQEETYDWKSVRKAIEQPVKEVEKTEKKDEKKDVKAGEVKPKKELSFPESKAVIVRHAAISRGALIRAKEKLAELAGNISGKGESPALTTLHTQSKEQATLAKPLGKILDEIKTLDGTITQAEKEIFELSSRLPGTKDKEAIQEINAARLDILIDLQNDLDNFVLGKGPIEEHAMGLATSLRASDPALARRVEIEFDSVLAAFKNAPEVVSLLPIDAKFFKAKKR